MKYFGRPRKEAFANYVNGLGFQITEPGPLHAPTVSVSVKRNKKNLDLILECVLANDAVSTHVASRPGEIRMIAGTVTRRDDGDRDRHFP